jgi:hypothetical protein
MTIDSLIQQVGKQRGKSGGWPSELTYLATETDNVVEVTVSDAGTAKDGVWKKIDPWGLAFFDRVKECTQKPIQLIFSLRLPSTPTANYQYEALKRRVSYLATANPLRITLLKDNCIDTLYSIEELTHRPDCEIVRTDMKKRGDADKAGRLEKDFQSYLFGKGLHDPSNPDIRRTNERLALFGDDFVRIGNAKSGKDGKRYKVEREFPTGVFCDEVKKSKRILSTEYVDLVTINKNGEVAVIELKFDDPKLEVIPQVLNYALYFYAYKLQLIGLLDKQLEYSTKGARLVTYLVSNTFHPKFKSVWNYYSRGPLTIKQVIMGYYA